MALAMQFFEFESKHQSDFLKQKLLTNMSKVSMTISMNFCLESKMECYVDILRLNVFSQATLDPGLLGAAPKWRINMYKYRDNDCEQLNGFKTFLHYYRLL